MDDMDEKLSDDPTVGELLDLVEQLREENQRLRDRVQKLEWKIAQDSSNSHRPPSTDPPGKDDAESEADQEDASDGSAPESEESTDCTSGSSRDLLDENEVDEVHEHRPEWCECCGEPLSGEDLEPWRHQVWDVEIERTVQEHRMHRLECCGCGHSTRAELPESVHRSPFGPKVTAWTGMLTGSMDVTKRKAQRIVEKGFKIPIGLGTVCRLESRVSSALAKPVDELHHQVCARPAVWVDETSWNEAGDDCWLWAAVTEMMAIFAIQSRRNREALQALIPADYEGIVTSDRYSVYNGREPEFRQICWAHLFRDLEGLRVRDGPAGEWAAQLQTLLGKALNQWHRCKAGEIARASFRSRVDQRWRPMVASVLESAAADSDLPGLFGRLDKREPAIWQFAYHEGLKPTNNRAERAVRPAVVKRKISYGTESAGGSRFIERMLSVGETLRRQGREAIDYLIKAVERHTAGQPVPSLLPS
jgi:hypothetical protein